MLSSKKAKSRNPRSKASRFFYLAHFSIGFYTSIKPSLAAAAALLTVASAHPARTEDVVIPNPEVRIVDGAPGCIFELPTSGPIVKALIMPESTSDEGMGFETTRNFIYGQQSGTGSGATYQIKKFCLKAQ
jgi:hypothetical protein